ncbi:MAG: tetratricopeptide TPR2 repeat protein [Gallionellaceae bacterium]|nr:MAG: tetratricopeptide TPR2 repeat protein [Gallionellaceae bacterium]
MTSESLIILDPQAIEQNLAEAVAHQQVGEFQQAEERYRAILQSYPSHAIANHNLGVLLVQTARPSDAIPYFNVALDADPARGQYWVSYIDALFQAGQVEDARQILVFAQQQGLQGDEVDALAFRLNEGSLEQEQIEEAAIPEASLVVPIKPARKGKIPSAHEINTLITLFSSGRLEEALSMAESMTSRFPSHEFGWKALGAIFKQLGRSAEALPPMEKAAALSPDDVEAQYNLGVTLQEVGRSTDAEASYRRALKADPRYIDAYINLGILLRNQDRLDEAKAILERAIKIHPNNAEALSSLGVVYKDLEQLDMAESLLRRALRIKPEGVAILSNLGITLQQQKRWDEAEASFRHALQLDPFHIDTQYNLGVTLQSLERLDEAESVIRDVLIAKPEYAEGYNTLGSILQGQERLEEAESCFRRALEITPNYAEAYSNLGGVLLVLRKADEAEVCCRKALEITPDLVAAFHHLSSILERLGRLEEAEECCRRVLEIKPDYADAYNNLGAILMGQDRRAEAEASCRCAIDIEPDYEQAHNNLAVILLGSGRLIEAEASCLRALMINPDYAQAHNNLGTILQSMGRRDEAEACHRRAIKLKSEYAEAHSNLGVTLRETGRLVEAEGSLRRAIELKPDFSDAHMNLGAVLKDIGELEEAEHSFTRALQINPASDAAFSNLLFCRSHNPTVDAATLFAEHSQFGERFEAPYIDALKRYENTRDPDRILNIGFVSGDLRNHAMAYFIEPIFEHLAGHTQIVMHAYSNHSLDDDITQRIRSYFAHWNVVYSLSDAALDKKLRADRIDILIDLSGHTAKNRLLTFARKPAPLQASWMGYPGTTGMRSMDYYFTDHYLLPPSEFDDQFTEKLVHLPASAPFLPSQDAPPLNDLPALANGYVTFGSFNRTSKISRSVVAVWSKILRAVPDARMVLGGMPEDGKYDNLIEWFLEEEIARERLDFFQRSNMANYLKLHHKVDVCFDTFPYNGGTTTLHSVWMGVPTLTFAGSTVAGRTGAGVLSHAGLQAFIAYDEEEFVRKGTEWAREHNALAEIRVNLRERFSSSAAGRPELIAAGLVYALRMTWRRWCADLPAVSFAVTQQQALDAMKEVRK